jgi:long-subunit acyl-CoA synthetase (AMP-forming)
MYGLSEIAGTTTISYSDQFSLSHAGVMMSGSHVKIAEPEPSPVPKIC